MHDITILVYQHLSRISATAALVAPMKQQVSKHYLKWLPSEAFYTYEQSLQFRQRVKFDWIMPYMAIIGLHSKTFLHLARQINLVNNMNICIFIILAK